MVKDYQVAIVGAGPLGLELAIALKESGISYIQFDKGQVAETIYRFPVGSHFFSSSERIGIAGMPIQISDQTKCSRELYLAYIRAACMKYQLSINTYEDVKKVRKDKEFDIETESASGRKRYRSRYMVLATGGTSYPRLLGIPGEEFPHVHTSLRDPHVYFGRQLLIIGGKNSAVEGAIRAFHAGARTTIVTRSSSFDSKTIKYWLLPELMGRIERDEILCYHGSEVKKILATRAILSNGKEVPADFVLKAIGFESDMRLFHQLGVTLGDSNIPAFDEGTMETDCEGVYVLGTAVGGTQESYKVYIENTHHHVGKIIVDLSEKLGIVLPNRKWYSTTYTPSGPLEE